MTFMLERELEINGFIGRSVFFFAIGVHAVWVETKILLKKLIFFVLIMHAVLISFFFFIFRHN